VSGGPAKTHRCGNRILVYFERLSDPGQFEHYGNLS